MKLFARLHAIIILSIATVLYITHLLPSLHPVTRVKKVWNRSTTHVVVFGDSWSTHRQPDSPTEKPMGVALSSAPGTLWVDVLCSEVICNEIHDYAQSLPTQRAHHRGPVIDNGVYANATRALNISSDYGELSDVRSQIEQFLLDDAELEMLDSNAPKRSSTIFTIFVGIWEVWAFVELSDVDAEQAILMSLASLFMQLDKLVLSRLVQGARPTIIIPKVPDPTWFPRWFNDRTGLNGTDVYGHLQRGAVTLTDQWNEILEIEAQHFRDANIIVPDFNKWILDQMRKSQRELSLDPADGNILGKYSNRKTGFTELRLPCVNYTALTQGEQATCSDPSSHLFWDDTRLTGTAHELLGKHVAQMLRNQSIVRTVDLR